MGQARVQVLGCLVRAPEPLAHHKGPERWSKCHVAAELAGIAAQLPVVRFECYLLLALAVVFESGARARCGMVVVQLLGGQRTVQNDGGSDTWRLSLHVISAPLSTLFLSPCA